MSEHGDVARKSGFGGRGAWLCAPINDFLWLRFAGTPEAVAFRTGETKTSNWGEMTVSLRPHYSCS
jgi:hypothetical protein